jgi:hypothetical protein
MFVYSVLHNQLFAQSRPVYDPNNKTALRATHVGYCVLLCLYVCVCGCSVGRGSSVGIATTLRAERTGDRVPVGGGAIFSAPV